MIHYLLAKVEGRSLNLQGWLPSKILGLVLMYKTDLAFIIRILV